MNKNLIESKLKENNLEQVYPLSAKAKKYLLKKNKKEGEKP